MHCDPREWGYRLCGRSSSGQGLRTQGRGRPLWTGHLVPQAPGCGRQSGFARSALLRCSLAAVNRKGSQCDPFVVRYRRLTCKRRGLSRSTVGTGGGVCQLRRRTDTRACWLAPPTRAGAVSERQAGRWNQRPRRGCRRSWPQRQTGSASSAEASSRPRLLTAQAAPAAVGANPHESLPHGGWPR